MKITMNGFKIEAAYTGFEYLSREGNEDTTDERGDKSLTLGLESYSVEFDKSETGEVMSLIKELACFGMQMHKENLADRKEDREFRREKTERDFKLREQELDLRRRELEKNSK